MPGGVDIATLGLVLDGRQMRAESARVSASLGGVQKSAASATATMLKLALALGALVAFKKAVSAAGEFEGAMTRSLAIMNDVDDVMRNRLSDAARQVGIELNLGATQAAEAFFFLASAGLNAQESLAALVPVAEFAKAGMFDMATATDLATDAQSALGLRTGEAAQDIINLTRVTDVLVKANTLANATVQQFSASLTTEAGAALKTFNKDIEEGVAVLAVFADQGVKAELAGSALSRILRIMSAAAVNNEDAYKQLGIEVFDTSGEMNNFADIIEDLENSLGSMSDETRVASLQQLGFTARVQGVINPLIGASKQIREYEDGLRQAGGITKEIAEKQLQAPMERAGVALKTFGDAGITLGQNILKVMVPALESLAANAGLVIDVILTLGVALIALKLTTFVGPIFALAKAFRVWAVATTLQNAALALMNFLLAPATIVILATAAAVALVAGAFFLWRRRVRETTEAQEANNAQMVKDTERVGTMTEAQLGLARAQAIRLLTESQLARSAGTITEEEELRSDRFLNLLRQINKETQNRASAVAIDPSIAGGVGEALSADAFITSAATQQSEIELERARALNEAFGQTAGALARINIEFDLQSSLIENTTKAKGEDLKALNAQTEALVVQKLRALELNEALDQAKLEAGRERALARIEAENAAIGKTAVEVANLNVELERQDRLAADREKFQGQALADAETFTNAIAERKLETIALTEIERVREELAEGGRELERQQMINDAVGSGALEQAKLNVELARTAALRTNEKKLSGQALIDANAITNATFDLRGELVLLNLELGKGSKLPELYEAAARGIQQALSSGFNDIIKDGIGGFEDMASQILDIFTNLATEIAGALAADALGLDDLLQTLSEGGDLSRGQQLGGAALIGGALGIQVAGGGGAGGAAKGALSGAATGFALGGPVGAGVGAVAGAIGGFFGGGPSKEDVRAFQKNLDDILRALQPEGFRKAADSIEAATKDILSEFRDVFDIKNFNKKFREATGTRTGDLDIDTVVEDILKFRETFAPQSKEYQELTKVAEIARLQIKALREEQQKASRDFDVDLRVREARAAGDEVGAITAARIAKQQDELEAARKLVEEGTITEEMFQRLARVLDTELAQAIENVEETSTALLESLMDFQQGLLLGSVSTLSPVQQLEEARRQFEETRALALGGDAQAAADLPAVSQRLLELSRNVNASGQGFVDDFNRVQSTVDLVITEFGRGFDVQTEILTETQTQTVVLQELQQTAEQQRQEIEDANREIILAFQRMFEGREEDERISVSSSEPLI